ncbi:MAG: hypothetical protein GXO65_03320 [Euryarchaeota archaeon]|nr:hypothetical protein [Euryarchaeota archaeon]
MGEYSIARDEAVEAAILDVLKNYGEVHSLESLHQLVTRNLRRHHPRAVVSPERVRRRAALMEGVRFQVEKRRSGREARRCYVCGGQLEPFETIDVYGKRTPSGRRCRDCGFRIEKRGYLPRRYRFYLG